MKETVKYKNKKILILGLAKSGLSAAKLLHRLGALITVNDYKKMEENPEARELLDEGIKVITGGHPEDLLDEDFELLVKNPGIPYTNPVVKKAFEKGIEIVTEVEIGLSVCDANIIAVTGTNGKTTTTTLLNDILNTERSNGKAYAAGNIGTAVSQVVQEAGKEDDIVMELSSFQLLGTPTLKPDIAIITNIYSAHLDYHGTREHYVQAKMNITKLQDETDYLIYNKDSKELAVLVEKKSKAVMVPFSRKEVLEEGACVKGDMIYFNGEPVASLTDIKLPGQHNVENVLAAVAAAKLKNVPNEVIRSVLQHFSGVKHRSQFVGKLNERVFINDSKATNSLATKNAVDGFERPVILLAGGLDRGDDFSELIPSLEHNVKAMITFGETGEKLLEAGKSAGIKKTAKVDSIAEAVKIGYEFSEEGDIILLSPACASWDQYVNFEVRGDIFIEAVKSLMKEDGNEK